ncbi:MAG: ATP-binding cassette domain-containing protein [Aminobacterium sp.]|jgi:energy-coupling factor transport system ATP-binding protein|uniref:Energy-coupling factor transporter ATP-binding protein EcfA2 n=1 Tax=bioreactor metagenome TaxID=1076179 RepID=A0A644ZUU8_9ZZZZ|nr:MULTISPECIES: ATP-binding cassette domain-containing protein [unclassified Aminobacterium]MDD2207383.1 ATP-binding cassette domain-containing protein [Aminobacterium sp.]MDD3426003.1 ATP-binding cassette domain-containing protein [Aminobacterium sp.]MDD3707846.1 ATP-binding cassette domain-containing protein [Aminobacterium sp.]MDD4229438.1 ATP-binding cassette domain-containing protein [Aminobacterium sp.]MDD4552108.1 ATP-binding cassette domain-containing protein [Aminobacterium sp.]
MSIIIKNLTHIYHPSTPLETVALKDISLQTEKGQWLSIVGHTGSGKSTLAQHLNALIVPEKGEVVVENMVARSGSSDLRKIRHLVGLVFQYPEQQLFAETVFEEVAFAPRNWGVPEDELQGVVERSLLEVGLSLDFLDRNPFQLSGGEKRRIALASVLAADPAYVVLDEPTAGLDATGRKELVRLLLAQKDKGRGIVFVTHDLEIALMASDSILVLEGGREVVQGPPKRIVEELSQRPVRGLCLPQVLELAVTLNQKNWSVPLTWEHKRLFKAIQKKVNAL